MRLRRFVSNFAKLCVVAALTSLIATCGGDGGGEGSRVAPHLSLFAGSLGGPGNIDGIGAEARFYSPEDIATDRSGNLYVTDGLNTIRKITPAGLVTTLAGASGQRGGADGTGAEARFLAPRGIAANTAGNVYVADLTTIRKITPAGVVTTVAGAPGVQGSNDGAAADARFHELTGLTVDDVGNVYVVDSGDQTIRKLTTTGVVSTLAGAHGTAGNVDGVGPEARFNFRPSATFPGTPPTTITYSVHNGLAIDSAGNLLIADSANYVIRKVTPSGTVSTLNLSSQVNPRGIAIDRADNLYLCQYGTVGKISPDGAVTTIAGELFNYGTADGTSTAARFDSPIGISADSAGNLVVTDGNTHRTDGRIRKITPSSVVSTFAGSAGQAGDADGNGANARFSSPRAITVDDAGVAYVSNGYSVRKITSQAEVSTLAAWLYGQPAVTFTALAADGLGNVYFTDYQNSTIGKITPAGVVSTVAGKAGEHGANDGIGADARFDSPNGIAMDRAGNVYVADSNNRSIRKITPAGAVSTLAGMAGQSGSADGLGAAARFSYLGSLATDRAGNVYVIDNFTVRKISPSGEVISIAGAPGVEGALDGAGQEARFGGLSGIGVDDAGNMYVADGQLIGNALRDGRIRRITSDGVVSTFAGLPGLCGFKEGALPGALCDPGGIAVKGRTLYVTLYNGVAVVTNLP